MYQYLETPGRNGSILIKKPFDNKDLVLDQKTATETHYFSDDYI